MVTAIFSAIAALPQLCTIVENLVTWVSNQIALAKKQKLADDMAKAAAIAQKQKDTSGIDNLFDPSKKK